jgi:hypothetical protein
MNKLVIALTAVGIVAVVAVAAFFLMGGGDKEWETTPDDWILSHDVKVGDWIEMDDVTYEIKSVDGNDCIVEVTKGYSTTNKSMSKKEFFSLLTSKKQLELWTDGFKIDYSLKYKGTETIETYFGMIPCKVYSGTATGKILGSEISQNLSIYIGDHGIVYRFVTDYDDDELMSNLSFL